MTFVSFGAQPGDRWAVYDCAVATAAEQRYPGNGAGTVAEAPSDLVGYDRVRLKCIHYASVELNHTSTVTLTDGAGNTLDTFVLQQSASMMQTGPLLFGPQGLLIPSSNGFGFKVDDSTANVAKIAFVYERSRSTVFPGYQWFSTASATAVYPSNGTGSTTATAGSSDLAGYDTCQLMSIYATSITTGDHTVTIVDSGDNTLATFELGIAASTARLNSYNWGPNGLEFAVAGGIGVKLSSTGTPPDVTLVYKRGRRTYS